MKLQVLLADDHALFRDGMRYVLQQLSDEVEIFDAASFGEALAQAEAHPELDLALLDLNMPGSDGVTSIRIFHQRFPGVPLVVVSGSDQRTDIEWVMEYGAMGFISKMTSGKIMVSALRMVLDGGIYLPPQLLAQSEAALGGGEMDHSNAAASQYNITKRQQQVLQHLAAGLTNKEISSAMNLAEGTVKVHIAAAYQTLKVGSRVDAVRKARSLGLIDNVPDVRPSSRRLQ
ncbi:MAG TPA: response regulator transcription factor [Gallionellaceae bacterium]|jgi:DNA-binding NarL/FixJ family response regulator